MAKRRGPPPPIPPWVRDARFKARFQGLRPEPVAYRNGALGRVPVEPPMKPVVLVSGRSAARIVPNRPIDHSEVYQEAALRKAVYYAQHVDPLGQFLEPASEYMYPQPGEKPA